MLRTSMGDQSLIQLFKKLDKDVTKDNAHMLCAVACNAPEIFMAPAFVSFGEAAWIMCGDIRAMYCYTRGLPSWSPYSTLVRKVIAQYGIEEYKSSDTLKAIFDELDKKIAQIRKLLSDDNFPDLD